MILGTKGGYESEALEGGLIFAGFEIDIDLKDKSEEQIKQFVAEKHAGRTPGQRGSYAGQLTALSARMKIGDLIVVVSKRRIGHMAIGRVTGKYEFDPAREAGPHTRRVDWIHPAVALSPFWSPYLSYLHARKTLDPVRDRETVAQVLRFIEADGELEDTSPSSLDDEEGYSYEAPVHDIARLQVASLIDRRFPGKEMERLVAGVLEAEGYTIAPPVNAADQGVDVLAGHGLLGFDPPLMCVQVKHEQGSTGAPIVQQLRGAVEDFGAQQGLFVSWGGFTRDAEREARKNFFRLRLWTASDLIDAVCRNYAKLSAELRAEIPLQQVWAVVPEDSNE